ncbi:MAG: hypothetical protein ACXWH7_12010 [Thermoanaerobaculia bacterium]
MNNIASRVLLLALFGLAAPLFATSPPEPLAMIRGDGADPPFLLSWSGNSHRDPQIATSPHGHFVAWTEDDGMYATRIDENGSSLDGRGMLLSTTPGPTRYSTHWVDRSINVYAARVTAGLTLLDPAPLLVAATGENDYRSFGTPSVASNGADWLVVADLAESDVLARRVLQNGTVEGDAPAKIGEGIQPAVAWDGVRYAVVWKEGHWTQRARPIIAAAVPAAGALVATRRTAVTTSAAWSAPAITSTAIAYTKVSFLPEHTGVERTFLRMLDLGAQRGRVVRR